MRNVLVVDDNSANLYMLKILLEKEGLEVITSENGKDALEKARRNPPDLIVSDILMPVMDGYSLCRKCKSDKKLKSIPFVFYTATYTSEEEEKFALSLGADRFLVKPQEPEILIKILIAIMEEKPTVKPAGPKSPGEVNFSRQHNEILFRKLEKKMAELDKINRELKVSEEKYRELFEHASIGIYEVDYETGRFTSVNDVICEYTGYTRDELLNMNFSGIFTEESLKLLGERLEKLSANERIPPTVEYSIKTKSGDTLWILLSAQYVYETGKLKGASGVIYNITNRKQAEKVLLENETKYRLLADHMKDLVWLMDMDLKGIYISPSVEKLLGYTIDELKTSPILKLLTPASVKTALDFFSLEMPRALAAPPNYSLKRFLDVECRSKDGRPVWLEVGFSLIRNENGTPVSILGEARDITERKQAEEKLQQTLESLKRAVGTTIQVLVNALESKDPYTAGHQSRSANLASAIATEMGLDANKIEGIRMASSIHDIGKLSVPSEILTKPTKLLDIEFSLIKEHSEKGYEMLKNVESDWPLAEIVYQHHERMNGSGYPRHLKVDDILLESRILAVADVVEAMGSHRPYRPALGIKIALEEIEKNKGILYDADVADACLRLFREKGYELQ